MASQGASADFDLFDPAFARRLRALSLLSHRTGAAGAAHGQRRARAFGPGSEFADYREYSSGDDYRHVDWNAYARSERLLVRRHQREVDLDVHVLLDCSGSMAGGAPPKLRYGQQLAAAIAYLATARYDRVSFWSLRETVEASVTPPRGPQGMRAAFEFLRGLDARGNTDLQRAVRSFAARCRRRGLALLISDLFDPRGAVGAIEALRRARFDAHVLRLVDPRELEPALRGELELVDAESGRTRRLTITPALLSRYREARQREARLLARSCADHRVPLHVLDTRGSPERALLGLLRRGGLVG
jgi:uncharacterized protein (DUF58 family)